MRKLDLTDEERAERRRDQSRQAHLRRMTDPERRRRWLDQRAERHRRRMLEDPDYAAKRQALDQVNHAKSHQKLRDDPEHGDSAAVRRARHIAAKELYALWQEFQDLKAMTGPPPEYIACEVAIRDLPIIETPAKPRPVYSRQR